MHDKDIIQFAWLLCCSKAFLLKRFLAALAILIKNITSIFFKIKCMFGNNRIAKALVSNLQLLKFLDNCLFSYLFSYYKLFIIFKFNQKKNRKIFVDNKK